MARPVNADAEATRNRILQSALELFSERGKGSTSIREVARRAEVSLAMVHHYFGSKNELYESCIDQMYAELSPLSLQVGDALASSESPLEVPEIAVRTGFKFAVTHRRQMRLLMRSIVDSGEFDGKRREEVLAPFEALVCQAISSLNGVPPEELRLPLQSVIFLVVRYAICNDREIALHASGKPDTSDMEQHFKRVEDHLTRAALQIMMLAAPPPPGKASE